jgi:hypothetical protein
MIYNLIRLGLILSILTGISYGQTITSTTTGGNWEDAATWIGNTVPTAANDVVINGPVSVTVSTSACKNLTINAGAVLQNGGSLGWVTLVVNGNLVNNGTMRNNPSAYEFWIDLRGDIHNNGSWKHSRTYIARKQIQHISQTTGKVFENDFTLADHDGYKDTNGQLIATSPLTFSHRFDLQWLQINMNGYALTMTKEAHLRWGTVRNASDVYFQDSSFLVDITYVGSVNLHGVARIDGNVAFMNDVTVMDTMQHRGGLGWVTPVVYGKFTNNGLLRDNPVNGWDIRLDLRGDIHNNGIWRPNATYIALKNDQHISQSPGKVFENDFALRDGNGYKDTTGKLIATSPLTFANQFDLNWLAIDMNDNPLTLKSEGYFRWGTILNVPDLYFQDSALLIDLYFANDIRLHGVARIDGNVNFLGSVVVLDTIQHRGGLGWVTMRVDGNFTNEGVARNNPLNNWGLWFRISGDIRNNGTMTNAGIELDGTNRRNIYMPNASMRVSVIGKKVILTGDNIVPSLEMSSQAICIVASEATLTIMDGTSEFGWNGVSNLGRIIIPRKPAVGTASYKFYSGTYALKNPSVVPDSINIETYSSQTTKNFGNAVIGWWRVNIVPPTFGQPECSSLRFYYADANLNGNNEDSLTVWRSADGGKSWTQIPEEQFNYKSRDYNYIELKDITLGGDYVIAARGTAMVPARPNVRVNLIGSSEMRVLAPNRFVVNMYNSSDAPSGDFVIGIEGGDRVRFLSTEDELDGFKRKYSENDLVTDSNSRYFTMLVSSMAPHEERDFTLYATLTAPNGTLDNGQKPQVLWFLGVAAVYVAGAYISDYITDKMVQGCFELWAPQNATEAQKQIIKEELSTTIKQQAKKAAVSTGKQLVEDGAKHLLKKKGLENLVWPVKMGANMLACLENSIKGMQCYLGLKMIKDVFTHVDCNGQQREVRPAVSKDPNHKSGPAGYGPQGYIASAQRMEYMIECENDPDAASPAYKIVITDSLADEFDESTVVFGRMSHSFTATRSGKKLTWEITGIDLPPNKKPTEGEAWVTYSVMPKQNLPSGTTLGNNASIVFDVNAPIITNTYVNTLDFIPPVSTMKSLPSRSQDTVITVRWQSDDQGGSGYESATLYVAVDDGEYQSAGVQDGDSIIFGVNLEHTYSFFVMAKDNAGNLEKIRPVPVSIRITNGVKEDNSTKNIWLREPYPNPAAGIVHIDFSLDRPSEALIEIIDILGNVREVALRGFRPEGVSSVQLDASQLPAGTYYIRMTTSGVVRTKKLVIR